MLNILGPGQHLFISAVSKAWRESYARVASIQMTGLLYRDLHDETVLRTVTAQMTLGSAVFASASRVNLAHERGLTFDNKKLQRVAGKVADVPTLRATHELGLELRYQVLSGAAEAASLPKLQWLHTTQGCPLYADVTYLAARVGSVDTLRWLRSGGCAISASTCRGAAAGAHTHMLQFLREEGCGWDYNACAVAARRGHVSTLKWLHEQGCPWKLDEISCHAAEGGSIETLLYLKQRGVEYNALTMGGAACQGHLAVCQFLAAEGCPWGVHAAETAAIGGHLSTLRWMREHGCLWVATDVCSAAANYGSVEMLQYLKEQGCVFDADTMRAAVQARRLHVCKFLRAEQCPWFSSAGEAAARCNHVEMLHWLHDQGYPWDIHAVRLVAVEARHTGLLEAMQHFEPAANAAQLTELLKSAGRYDDLMLVKWLRQQGANWPANLAYDGDRWSAALVQWARDEGCVSPV
jgi:hypothetical protein